MMLKIELMGKSVCPKFLRTSQNWLMQRSQIRCFKISLMFRTFFIILIFVCLSTTTSADRIENPKPIRFLAVGDMMLGRNIAKNIRQNGPEWLLGDVKSTLSGSDILFGNLESPLTSDKSLPRRGFGFTGDPEMARWLKDYGFTVLSVSNNHAFDRGAGGITDTLKYLSKFGIVACGGGTEPSEPYQPQIVDVKGTKFAFFAAESIVNFDSTSGKSGVAFLDSKKIISEIKKIRNDVDFVIVSLHWGNEYKKHPNTNQIRIAHDFIDNGADVIIGHHPHVLQGIERYKDGLIFYSLGNFIFDQRDEPTKRSVIAAIDFYPMNRWLTNPMVTPIAIKNYHPVLDSGNTREKTIGELIEYGKALGKDGVSEFSDIAPAGLEVPPPLPTDILK